MFDSKTWFQSYWKCVKIGTKTNNYLRNASSSNVTNHPDDIGQLITWYYCDMLKKFHHQKHSLLKKKSFGWYRYLVVLFNCLRFTISVFSLYFYMLCAGTSHVDQRNAYYYYKGCLHSRIHMILVYRKCAQKGIEYFSEKRARKKILACSEILALKIISITTRYSKIKYFQQNKMQSYFMN